MVNDRSEFYEVPKHHAIDVLANVVVNKKKRVEALEREINALYDMTNLPYESMFYCVNMIIVHQKDIKECTDAIKWIYNQIL